MEEVDFTAWAPPAPTSHVVIRTFVPSKRDEHKVAIGDLIGIEKYFEDGWVRVQNITQNRTRGMMPLAILTPIKSGPTQTVLRDQEGEANVWKSGIVELPDNVDETIHPRESSLKYRDGSLKSKLSLTDPGLNSSSDEEDKKKKKVVFDTKETIIESRTVEEES